MLILGVDVETSGNPEGTESLAPEVLELGLVLYDTEVGEPINQLGRIYNVTRWGEDAEAVHRIPKRWADVSRDSPDGWNPCDVVNLTLARYIVAHGAIFDAPIVKLMWSDLSKLPWLCTCDDLPHEDVIGKVRSRRLGHLMHDYGIPYPIRPHRAVPDALACCQLAARHDLDAAYQRKLMPKYELRVFPASFDKKLGDQLREAGWRYCGSEREGVSWPNGFRRCYYRTRLLGEEVTELMKPDVTPAMAKWQSEWVELAKPVY